MSKTVMFIHGAWLTPASWDLFRSRFEAAGFDTIAPAWPLEHMPIERLRNDPHPDLGKLTVGKIVDHYEKLVRALPEAPILVGHSYGGLFTQMLLDRGLGAAGVALDPVPFRGVLPTPRALWSALPAYMHWGSWSRPVSMSFERFTKDFAQTLPADQMRAAFDKYIVPTPGRLYYQAALAIGTGIHVGNPDRAPLLLMAGESDVTIEPSMVRAAFEKQKKSPSRTSFMSFGGRSHFLFAEPGWEEVADAAIDWTTRIVGAPKVTPAPKGKVIPLGAKAFKAA
ncbi:alpha/beta hydrolase [Labilithrix luteola]|nr:alpha/beta hydrolase [Labilithrix luteola]